MLSFQDQRGDVTFVLKKKKNGYYIQKSSELILGDLAVFLVIAPQKMLRRGFHLLLCAPAN